MYYPIGWHKVLKLDLKCDEEPCNILSVQANHERELFFILTSKSIHVWFPRPTVEIVCHRRSEDSIKKNGLNKSAVWRTDSSVIVVATDRDQLLFYQIRPRDSSSNSAASFLLTSSTDGDSIYRLCHDSKNLKGIIGAGAQKATAVANSSATEFVPALSLYTFGKLDLSSIGVSCLMSAEEEMIVGAKNGNIYGVHWNGQVDNKFPWCLPKDLQTKSEHVIDLKFSSILAGFALVLSSGRAGFMPHTVGENIKQENGLSNGQQASAQIESTIDYLPYVNNVVCTEINHKYRLVAFGLNDSNVIVCNVGEGQPSLVINHKLDLNLYKFPHDVSKLGSIKCMRYSPDNFALVTTWAGGHLAIWSVFGSMLFCTQHWQLESEFSSQLKPLKFPHVAWGKEGYTLWLNSIQDDVDDLVMINGKDMSDEDRMASSMSSMETFHKEEVLIMSIARSSLSSSPHMSCMSDSIILISENKLYLGPSVPHNDKFDHWIMIDIPQIYLATNYPIKYASVDRESRKVAIAGNRGIAIHSIDLSKWTLVSKKFQQAFAVCGDIIWWKEYLIVSCFNFINETYEIRAYPTDEDIVTQTTPMEVIRMSLFENRLLVLYSDGTLGMFMLNLRRKPLGLQIAPMENLVISNLPTNSYCIASIALTRLHFKNARYDDSIILNDSGKLFLLEREDPPTTPGNVTFKAVSLIAKNVEQFWISPEISSASEMSYFKKSLWLSHGGPNLQVWLPLLNDHNDPPTDLYMPERIMLPIKCDIYPLAIRSSAPNVIAPDDAIVLGAESDILHSDCKLFTHFPYMTVKRQCRVYLHRILRELLLNQHLGYYARKIAEGCQSLPYFAHCLELLLHEVLEDEATSPVPLPDPMLPQVVKFIKEFPVYLETVVHCARKSELSMWSHLFDEQAVGNPRKLFQECLEKHKLDTAASCLIILQSLDRKIVSQKMVKELIEAASADPRYEHLVKDLESFLSRAEMNRINLNGSPTSPTGSVREGPTN